MPLLFDLSATQPGGASAFTGGNEYAKAVFVRLAERFPDQVVAFSNPNRPLDSLVSEAARAVEHVQASWGDEVQRLLDRPDVSTLYSALPPPDVLSQDLSSVHWWFTLHGLRPYEKPTDRAERRMASSVKAWALAVAKGVARKYYRARILRHYRRLLDQPAQSVRVSVPSEHTKYSLLAALPEVDAADVVVTYSPPKPLGPPLDEMAVRDALAEIGVESERYVLVLSGDRWLKNGLQAACALDRLYESHPGLPLKTLVLGVRDTRRYLRHLRNPDRIVFGGYVPSATLEALYAHAFTLLYPTLNEGFGYPPLECMKYGVPVICGAVTSIPEVCGDAALYVDPRSEDEMCARILQLALVKENRAEMANRGRARAALIAKRQDAMLDSFVTSLADADA